MLTAVRHQQILNLLSQKGAVQIRDLQKLGAVSTMTLWRDLKNLEEQGLLLRVRGGAILPHQQVADFLYESKVSIGASSKARIAKEAASLVYPGSVIALEGGTTVGSMVQYLPKRGISVLTNSLILALKIRNHSPDIPIEIPGGWLSSITGNSTGPATLKWIAKRKVSMTFLSATAFDSFHGPMDPNPLEIDVKRAFQSISKKTIFLIDYEKFGKTSHGVTLHPKRIDLIITDKTPPPSIVDLLKKNQIEFKVVDTKSA